ncbi:indolepyruvate oxidoreductase subunit beta [Oscillospiraceae bacterium PP1C4]
MINCLLAGIGGQGTVLASKLISQTAMDKGQTVRTAETIGMAQRGGSVISHVRIGEDTYSPLIPKKTADILIGFEPSEAVRAIDYLKPDGVVVVSRKAIQPVTASLTGKEYDADRMLEFLQKNVAKLIIVDGDRICKECESTKVLNVALLGAAVKSGALNMTCEDIAKTIAKKVPEKFFEMNIKALMLGAEG